MTTLQHSDSAAAAAAAPANVNIAAKTASDPSRKTKASQVESLLRRKNGATINAICKTTGWQTHSCRAFLSGLRKKGRVITRSKNKSGTTFYRIDKANTASAEG